jgi:hypothetical protein
MRKAVSIVLILFAIVLFIAWLPVFIGRPILGIPQIVGLVGPVIWLLGLPVAGGLCLLAKILWPNPKPTPNKSIKSTADT